MLMQDIQAQVTRQRGQSVHYNWKISETATSMGKWIKSRDLPKKYAICGIAGLEIPVKRYIELNLRLEDC